MRRWLVPFGTRPEIVKIAPVVEALRDAGVKVHTLATGQHDDPGLADAFFSDLALEPDRRWTLPSEEGARVGAIMAHAYETLSCGEYGGVLLLGDTHTVPLFALAARRFAVPVVHLEAGLRSFNAQSVEEGNRRVAGALASLHLAPTELAARMLDAEGVSGDSGARRREPGDRQPAQVWAAKGAGRAALGRGRHDASGDERR